MTSISAKDLAELDQLIEMSPEGAYVAKQTMYIQKMIGETDSAEGFTYFKRGARLPGRYVPTLVDAYENGNLKLRV